MNSLPLLLVTMLLTLPTHAWATSAEDKLASGDIAAILDQGQSVRVIVQLDAGAEAAFPAEQALVMRYREVREQVLAQVPADGYDKVRAYSHLPMMGLRLKNRNALGKLLQQSAVLTVFPDRPHQAVLAQSLPLIKQPEVATVMGRSGSNATVAVLDTGGLYTRPELGSCTAVATPASCKVVAAQDFAYPDDLLDDNGSGVQGIGHGTEVAATVAGVAPGAKLALLDVFDGADAWSVDIIDAINWAIANRDTHAIAAINMSLGDGVRNTATCSKTTGVGANPFVTPIRAARNAGMVVVIASGNEGYSNGLASPACVSESLSVGSVYDANLGGINWGVCNDSSTLADKVACYSNSASFLDLLAPGSAISVVGNTVHGTSFAAPMAAGAIAVLKAAYPAETPAQLEARLTDSGVAVTDARNGLLKPRLNLLAAQGAPANDLFASPLSLSGASASAASWNFNATVEAGEPNHAGQSGGRSLWWSWVAPGDGTLTLDTHDSTLDTLLAVYNGTSVAALDAVAGNDNDAAASGGVSALSTPVSAGTTYRIAVDGKAAASGSIALHLAFAAEPPAADVSIGLAATQDPLPADQPAAYTLQVANAGPDVAQNVSVSLQIPAGWTLAGGAGCVAAGSLTAVCSAGNLAAAAGVTFNPLFNTSSQPDVYQLSATATADTADPNLSNNSAAVQTTLVAVPDGGTVDGDVPTLNQWAAMLMALLLYGLIVRRRLG